MIVFHRSRDVDQQIRRGETGAGCLDQSLSLFIDFTVLYERSVQRPDLSELVIQFIAIYAFADYGIASISW